MVSTPLLPPPFFILSRSELILTSRVVVGKHGPSMTTFLFVAVAIQIMIFGAWKVYKARRHGAPKKYL